MLFNREHVLPESFGKFRDNLVLHEVVCAQCNKYFGDTLDLALGRDSVEGLERYRWGVKPASDAEKFRYSAVQLKSVGTPGFEGVPLRIKPLDGTDEPTVAPIAACEIRSKEGDGSRWFTPEQIDAGEWKAPDLDWRKGVRITGSDPEVDRIRRSLEGQGVRVSNWIPLRPPPGTTELRVAQKFEITRTVKRAIAKIAFNYAAFVFGREVTLNPSFENARRFIRFDEGDESEFVLSEQGLPFDTPLPDHLRPVVHWLDVGGHRSHYNIVGRVVLFGFMTHRVALARDHKAPWPELPVAHLYLVKVKRVERMVPRFPTWKHDDRPE